MSTHLSYTTLEDGERQRIQQNITDLLALENYSVPTLEINGNANGNAVCTAKIKFAVQR